MLRLLKLLRFNENLRLPAAVKPKNKPSSIPNLFLTSRTSSSVTATCNSANKIIKITKKVYKNNKNLPLQLDAFCRIRMQLFRTQSLVADVAVW